VIDASGEGRAVPLLDPELRASRQLTPGFPSAVGPSDLQRVDLRRSTEPEGQRLFGGGKVGLPARDLLSLSAPSDDGGDPRADGVPVRLPVSFTRASFRTVEAVDEDSGGPGALDDDDVEVVVAVQVGERRRALERGSAWALSVKRKASNVKRARRPA